MLKTITFIVFLTFGQVRPQNSNLLEDESKINGASYAFAVDLATPTTLAQLNCLKTANYAAIFVRVFAPTGNGVFDANAVKTIRNAYTVGMAYEVYMTPQPISTLQGHQQFDLLRQEFQRNGINVKTIWIQVTSPANWQKSTFVNADFINSIVSRAKASGYNVGIYTNHYDWRQITGNMQTLSSDVLPWYWNVLGQGVTGEAAPNFEDFRSFGSFSRPMAKQFAQSEQLCGLTVNRDVFGVGSP